MEYKTNLEKNDYTKTEVIELLQIAFEDGIEKGIELSKKRLNEYQKLIAKYQSKLNLS